MEKRKRWIKKMTFMERIPQGKKLSSTLLIILILDLISDHSPKVTLMEKLPYSTQLFLVFVGLQFLNHSLCITCAARFKSQRVRLWCWAVSSTTFCLIKQLRGPSHSSSRYVLCCPYLLLHISCNRLV